MYEPEHVVDVVVSGGRTIRVGHVDLADRVALLVHAGTPHGLSEWPWLRALAADAGLAPVTFARPGYAGSTPRPGRTVADGAADTRAVVDALGIDRFVSLGISGGGPAALADGAVLTDRCLGVVVMAGLAPFDAPDLDAAAGLGPMNAPLFAAARAGRDELSAMVTPVADVVGSMEPEALRAMMSSGPDSAVIAGASDAAQILDYMAATSATAYRDGVEGVLDDLCAVVAPWGFDVGDVRCPVMVWHGALDQNVPQAHGRWVVDRVADGQGAWFDHHGHLSIMLELPSAIARAADFARGAPAPVDPDA